MEASVLSESSSSAALLQDPRARFLRLQSDERLVALTRRGNEAAFETLIARYRTRLLAFCRHMVGSTEDAEDILQEVFVSAYRAMLADDRELNVRPWLYRIARNRSLNHLRRPRPTGVDSMDIFEGGAAVATADRVHDKLDLEDLVEDVKRLPETQRTALMLREMGDLSYDQIAEAMDTTIPSVKSLLVRARVSLAEAAESRRLSCDEVRMELGAVSEGLQKLSAPARRHVGDCERCRSFKKELTNTNRKLAMIAPVGAFAAFKALVALKLFGGATAAGTGTAGAGGSAAAVAGSSATGAAATAAGAGASAAGSSVAAAGLGAVAAKVGTGLVAAAIVTGGVAQVAKHDVSTSSVNHKPAIAAAAPAVVDPAKTGGAPAGVVATDPTTATGATGGTGAAGPSESTPQPAVPVATEEPATHTTKPVVEKETTTVYETTRPESKAPSGQDRENPGLPSGSDEAITPAVPNPGSGQSSTGQTGSMVSPGPSPSGGATGATQ